MVSEKSPGRILKGGSYQRKITHAYLRDLSFKLTLTLNRKILR